MVDIAATQGVYNKVKVKKLNAERVVKAVGKTEETASALVPISTARVETTASFAVKPETSAVATRQSLKPSGLNTTDTHRPIEASKLTELSVTKLSL